MSMKGVGIIDDPHRYQASTREDTMNLEMLIRHAFEVFKADLDPEHCAHGRVSREHREYIAGELLIWLQHPYTHCKDCEVVLKQRERDTWETAIHACHTAIVEYETKRNLFTYTGYEIRELVYALATHPRGA